MARLMKLCPHCEAENWPDNTTCYACGGDLRKESSPGALGASPIPTQPVRVRPTPVQPQARPVQPANTTLPPPRRDAGAEAQPPPFAAQQAAPVSPPAGNLNSALRSRIDSVYLWRIFSVVLGLVLVFTCIFAIWMIGVTTANRARRAGEQMQTRVAQVQQQQTATAEPTSTPAPFEPTPWPTPTGANAPAEPAADWQKYLTGECSAAVNHLRAANDALSANPGSPFNADWRADLSAAVSDMKAYCGTLESASPVPDIVREAHANLTRATAEYEAANQEFKEGIEQLKPGKILDATARFRLAVKYLGLALEELEKIP